MELDTSTLSRRAQELLAGQSLPEYLMAHSVGSKSRFDPVSNPNGYIGLCVAENKLMAEVMADRIDRVPRAPESTLGYDAMTGSLRFRERLGRFLGRAFLGRVFPPEQVSVLAGAGSVLEILFHVLADSGDGVLVPTPSYAGFWLDLELRDRLKIVPVHTMASDDFRLTPALLDEAVRRAGRPVKALLFTTPDNPLGRVYTAEEIDRILLWAEARGLHVVLDEIYALSVFGAPPFISGATLREPLGDRLHIVWAFSKDFGASGLRCGVLVSENSAVNAAVSAFAYWACCSGHTQYLLGELVADDDWVDGFIAESQRLLKDAYDRLSKKLRAGGIDHVDAGAGVFTLLDLRPFLEAPTFDAEHQLWARIVGEARVNLTPGAACHVGEPGFMRLCYAGSPPEVVEIGIERILKAL